MPTLEDVSQATSQAQTPQPDAVQNIKAANMLEVSPDTYKDTKGHLQDFVNSLTQPVAATPAVANWMNKSSQHASAAAPDTEHLNLVDNIISTVKKVPDIAADVIQGVKRGATSPDQDRLDLLYKKSLTSDGKLNDDEELTLKGLNADAQSNYGSKDHGLSGWQKIPGSVAESLVGSSVGVIGRNPKLFGGIVAAETGLDASIGAVAAGPAGALVGALGGLATSSLHGWLAASVKDSYQNTTAQVYGDLDQMKDENGNPLNLSQENKKYLSHGAGVVIGSVQFVANKLLQGTLPAMNTFASKEAIAAALASNTLRGSMMRIGKITAEMGVAGGMQNIALQITNNLAQLKGDYSPEAIASALDKTYEDLKTNKDGKLDQLVQTAAMSATQGLFFGGFSEALPYIAKAGLGKVRDQVVANRPSGVERDVTPEAPKQLNSSQPSDGEIIIDNPDGPAPSNIHDANNVIQKADDALTLQDAIDASTEVIKQTKLHGIDPEVAKDFQAEAFEHHGQKEVWMDREAMNGFVDAAENDEERINRTNDIQKMHDPEGRAAAQRNEPIPIAIRKILDITHKYPDLSYYLQKTEDGTTPKKVPDLIKSREEQQQKLQALNERLTPLQEAPEERAQKAALQPDSSKEEIAKALMTKEGAEAYVARLDKNEEHEQGKSAEIFPGGLTKEEYLATGEDLMHGTSHPFDKFQQNPESNYKRNDNGGVYFTDKESIANTFANEGSRKGRVFETGISTGDADRSGQTVSEVFGNKYDIPKNLNDAELGDLKGKEIGQIADALQASGKHEVFYQNDDGEMVPWKKGALDETRNEDAYLKIYPKDHGPKVIKTKVYGKSIDLLETKNWPKDLVETLKTSTNRNDQHLYQLYHDTEHDPLPAHRGVVSTYQTYQLFANSPALKAYAQERGIGKIIQPDASESGGRSYYVPDVKHIEYGHDVSTNGQRAPEVEKQLADIQKMRERVKQLAEQLPSEEEAKKTHQEALAELTKRPSDDIAGEEGFLDQTGLDQVVKDLSTAKEAEKVSNAVREARTNVAEGIRQAKALEMMKVDYGRQVAIDAEQQARNEALHNKDIQLVDKFVTERSKNGKRVYSIDPSTLTKEQRRSYAKNDFMKQNKVWAKSSISPDEAAVMVGAKSGDDLLRALSQNPTTEQYVKNAVAKATKDPEHLEKFFEGNDLYKTKLAEGYSDLAKAHLKEMQFLKDQEWPATKTMIKRIGANIPVPSQQSLKFQAQRLIGNTKVGELTYKPFAVGERKSQKVSVNALVKGDIEASYNAKKAAALNSELAKEAHVATGDVNAAFKFFNKELQKKENQEILGKAGVRYVKAMAEITDVYNFDPKIKNQSDRDEAHKLFSQWVKEGRGDFSPTPNYTEVKTSANEMTVDQIREAHRIGQIILNVAKQVAAAKEGEKALEANAHIESLVTHLESHPDVDNRKLIDPQNKWKMSTGYKLMNLIENNNFLTASQNVETILVKLDQNETNGPMQKAIMSPIKGEGKFQDQGMYFRVRMREEYDAFEKKAIDLYNADEAKEKGWSPQKASAMQRLQQHEIRNMYSSFIEVPEWKDNPNFPDGKVSWAQMFDMIHQRGNEGNESALIEGHGLSSEEVQAFLDKHAPDRLVQYAQRRMDWAHEVLWPHIVKMMTELTGVPPKRVEPKEFTVRGVTYKGGWYPIDREPNYKISQVSKRVRNAMDFSTQFEPDDFDASTMTRDGHTKARVGGTDRLRLDPASFAKAVEAISHDIAFRRVLHEVTSLLADDRMRDAITKASGSNNYKALIENIKNVGKSQAIRDAQIYDVGSIFTKILARNQNVMATAMIPLNFGTMMIHPINGAFAAQRMGLGGAKHFTQVLAATAHLPTLFKMAEFAAEHNAAIRGQSKHIDELTQNVFTEKLGTKKSKVMKPLDATVKWANDRAFRILGGIDHFQKIVVFNAGYKQFVNGDAPGFSKDELAKMKPEEVHEGAIGYANRILSQTIRSSDELDRASIQNHPIFKFIRPFFNEIRSMLSNQLRIAREARWHAEDGAESFGEGDYAKAGKSFAFAASSAAMLMAISTVARFVIDTRNGFAKPPLLPDKLDKNSMEHYGKQWLSYFISAPFWTAAEALPGTGDAVYAYHKLEDWNDKHSTVSPLYAKPGEIIFDNIKLVNDFLEYHSLTKKQQQTLLLDYGYLTGDPLPIKALYTVGAALNNALPATKKAIQGGEQFVTQADQRIKDFIAKEQQNPPSLVEEVKDKADHFIAQQENPKPDTDKVSPEILDEVKKLREELGK